MEKYHRVSSGTDKGTKYIKKNKNTKSTVPFLNIENMEKFEASKMELIDKRKSEKRYDENIEGFFYTDINDVC